MIRLFAILSALTAGILFAVTPTPKGKAPAAAAASKSKAKSAPKTQAKTTAKKAAPAKGKAPTTAVRRAPTTGKSAVYSRSSRYGRNQTAARRGAPVARPQSAWQSQPTQERYREIQQALVDKGFFKGEVNGTWSKDSVDALKDFQRSQNLDPDGKLGSLSLIALGLGPKRIATATNLPPPPPPPPPGSPAKP